MKKIQDVKNFWNNRPCNIKHSPKIIGTQEYFKEVEKRRYFVEPHIPSFAQFEKWKGKKVLDIGCGIEVDAINFAKAGAELTIIEISKKSLEICKKNFKNNNFKARFYCGNAEELSIFLPVEKYDLIYSFGVIHHTPFPERIFEEIKKYCDAETEIRIMLYSKWSWKTFWIIIKYGKGMFWKASKLIPQYSEAQTGSPVTYYYSFRDIYKLMKDFEIMEIKKEHIFPNKIDKYVKYEYEKVWYFRYMPQFLFRWFRHCFGWHTLVVAKLKN